MPRFNAAETAEAPTVTATAAPTHADPAAAAPQAGEDTLRGRIREAVQAVVHCPAAARMMHRSGIARVAFDYRDGALTGSPQLAGSSGTPMLDDAAIAAVNRAHYPLPPPEQANRVLRLVISVEEACGG